jgi:hypothetical protein
MKRYSTIVQWHQTQQNPTTRIRLYNLTPRLTERCATRAAWVRPPQRRAGPAGLSRLGLPLAGQERGGGDAAALGPAQPKLGYGGHEVPGLSF